MTTITREQAQKIIDAADEVITALAGTNEDVHPESDNMLRLWDDLNDRYAPPEVVRELARIALASLEAKPIGAFHIADQQVDGTTDYIKDGEWPIDNGVIDVYAVPPAPVVPEEMPKGLAAQIVSLLAHNIGDKLLAQKIWNACRAVMLQAGWVMVPVEPTDEMIAAAMECDDVVFDSKDPTAFCVQFREIYCAMVDTAPKPEQS
ncbi:hypothetical protein BJN50_16740 [Salmonella enterica]|nr:hypothetical protein [Salmonella enterica]EAZ0443475.1 hypothetical protein [Salmonella enterica]EAZ0478903.1 hypothetical protein [Salmonella enterica]EBF4969843.1 hypothetical protein [Salmonella enterica]EBQ5308070.1 hypothetical protein [Salmonella enterica]